jgi:hypothetical protein
MTDRFKVMMDEIYQFTLEMQGMHAPRGGIKFRFIAQRYGKRSRKISPESPLIDHIKGDARFSTMLVESGGYMIVAIAPKDMEKAIENRRILNEEYSTVVDINEADLDVE